MASLLPPAATFSSFFTILCLCAKVIYTSFGNSPAPTLSPAAVGQPCHVVHLTNCQASSTASPTLPPPPPHPSRDSFRCPQQHARCTFQILYGPLHDNCQQARTNFQTDRFSAGSSLPATLLPFLLPSLFLSATIYSENFAIRRKLSVGGCLVENEEIEDNNNEFRTC